MAPPRRAATREEPALRPAPPPAAVRPDRPARRRLPGVDAARGIALLGMITVHVLDPVTADGAPHPAFLWFAGRASVLFVLLAGVGLALSTGGATPATGARRATLRRRIARRAGLLFVLGLACGTLGVPVAVILCHYALLFLLALPLLGLRARALGLIAGAWLVLGPVLVFAVVAAAQAAVGRQEFFVGGRLWLSPGPADLLRPGLLLADLTVTGYYPVLSWGAFLVLGLALGRLPLDRPRVAAGILGGGATAWAAALAPSYAPELEIVGAAAGGVPMNLSKMAQALGGQSHVAFGLAAAAALGLEREYPDRINVQGQLNDQGRFLAQWINNGCTNEIMFWGFLRSAGQLTDNRDFMNNPEGWKVLDENSLELYQPVPKTPIYEWHSPTDALIPVDSIDNTLRRYCAAEVKVTSLLTPTPDHLSAAVLGLVPGFEWMEQRFRGVPAPSNC